MKHYITEQQIAQFTKAVKGTDAMLREQGEDADARRIAFRHLFFKYFKLSHFVPTESRSYFMNFARRFYDKTSMGYDGIIKEIDDRTTLYCDISGAVEVREFLKHGDGKTDFYDKENRISYEKKTGCGDWLRSEEADTLEEVIAEYRRKKTVLRWDYDFDPKTVDMCGKKSVKKTLSAEEQEKLQERSKLKNDGTKVVNKQYAIHIHMEVSYKNFFDYLATYPAGVKTFFKESVKSNVAGVRVWELQTIKNSKKKIDFLQACPYNTARPDTEGKDE